jgi:SAM-dependent methyltransferase
VGYTIRYRQKRDFLCDKKYNMDDLFFEVHKDLPREGPGSNASTRQALALLPDLPSFPLILDVGCGPGMQTLELARLTHGKIIAVDAHQPFLDELNRQVRQSGLEGRIITANQSMFALDFPEANFDVIWSEGAIYIIGFEAGLRAWRRFLKPGGCVAVSEITWLRPDPPLEIRAYWDQDYPAISDLDQNLARVRSAGYRPLGHFVLPPSDWMDAYYIPLEARLEMLRQKYRREAQALAQLAEHQREIDLFRRYHEWYSYVFYTMQAA